MSVSQDNLLDYEENEAQGEDLLNQLVDSGRDFGEDMVVKYEREIQQDSDPKLYCDENNLFEDGISISMCHRDSNQGRLS